MTMRISMATDRKALHLLITTKRHLTLISVGLRNKVLHYDI